MKGYLTERVHELSVHELMQRTEDKRTWPPGPWQDEPDFKAWVDEASGLHCEIYRNLRVTGSLCGYVGLPDTHPLYGFHWVPPDDAYDLNENQLWWRIHVNRRKIYCLRNIEVHGGLSYAHTHDDQLWWFGFDCGHASDLCPKMDGMYGYTAAFVGQLYRDWAYVTKEVESLALQLSKIK